MAAELIETNLGVASGGVKSLVAGACALPFPRFPCRAGLVPCPWDDMQTVEALDDWRPGFAKRAANFAEVCDRARNWTWSPEWPVSRILETILVGASDLSPTQRMVLMVYARRLNHEDLARGVACVWPSTARVAIEADLSPNTLRAHRKALEAKGYLVRDYNRANRPADVEAFDLGPMLNRLPEMADRVAEKDAAIRAQKAVQRQHVVAERHICAQEQNTGRLEQSHLKTSKTVQEAAAPAARGHPPRQDATRPEPAEAPTSPVTRPGLHPRPNGSPGRARAIPAVSSSASVDATTALAELDAALELCPRLAGLVPPPLLKGEAPGAEFSLEATAQAVADLFPGPDRNVDDTFRWAWSRHGPRAFTMAAIALADPAVNDPSRYFGKLGCSDAAAAPDLRFNLVRLLKTQGKVPSPALAGRPAAETARKFVSPDPNHVLFAPGADDPTWRRVLEELSTRLPAGPLGSCFSRCGFLGLQDGTMRLVATSWARERILGEHRTTLLAAAAACGLDVERLEVKIRGQD